MAWKTVESYSLGYSVSNKQCSFYYWFVGEGTAYQIFVNADEMHALADMFRNEGDVKYNTDGNYFVTDAEKVGEGEQHGRIVTLRPLLSP